MVVIEINGMCQAQITISLEWETWEIPVSGEAVCQGVNEIMIRWPVHEFDSNEAFERVMEELFQWKNPEFYYVFGEIHSFTVSGRRMTLREDPPVQDEPAAV
jgi:hypothetical protein